MFVATIMAKVRRFTIYPYQSRCVMSGFASQAVAISLAVWAKLWDGLD
jgi:hypothetical protein